MKSVRLVQGIAINYEWFMASYSESRRDASFMATLRIYEEVITPTQLTVSFEAKISLTGLVSATGS